MARLLQDLRALYADYRRSCPQVDAAGLAQVDALLAQVEADPKVNGKLLTYLDQYVVPTFDFAQAYYNLNTPTTEHLNDFPGSLNHRIRVICCALREERDTQLGRGGFVMAVYPDHAVVCYQENYYYDYYDEDRKRPAETYWMVPYTYGEDTGEVSFGERVQVEVKTVVMPVQPDTPDAGTADVQKTDEGATASVTANVEFVQVVADAGTGTIITTTASTADLGQATKTKIENGQKFSSSAYLIASDADLPSTWQVRVEESPGKVTVAQLGVAHAALYSSYRGKKISATPEQKAGAKRKLRTLYKQHDAPWPGEKGTKQACEETGLPLWLLQGQDPPGGDQDLVQTITVKLQQEGEVGTDGVMHVEGIATVADVISRNNEVYPLEVWQDNMPRMQALIEEGRLLGEVDHPTDNQSSLQRTAMKLTSIWQESNQFKFKADILPTIPDGQNLQTLVKNGVAVDISSRGKGRIVQGTWQGVSNVNIVQRGYRADAFDAVKSGASPGSTITDWSLAQAADQSLNIDQEETEMGEVSEKILEAIQGLSSRMDKYETERAAAGAPAGAGAGAGEGGTQTQVAQPANDAAVGAATGGAQVTHSREEFEYIAKQAAEMRVESELRSLEGVWAQPWINLLRKQLETAAPKTLAEATAVIQSRKELVQQMLDQSPKFPGNGFIVQKSRGERALKTPNDVIEALVSSLPDVEDVDPMAFLWQDEEGKEHRAPDWVKSQRRQCRKVLQNVATLQVEGFNGPAAITALLRLEQGHDPQQVQHDFLNQACADGTTSVASGGAPTAAIYIFPLIRRLFPQLIANEIASIQPMDRPSGKIFFKDTYRINPTTSEVDENGSISSSRMRIDRTDSINPDYADRAAECDVSAILQLHISSRNVTAESKALHAVWTIEELQDLRAYHGLDVQQELMEDMAREIAMEWNYTILSELLAGATAGNANFGTTAPSGYTAKEWEEYLPRYLDLISTKIFQKRHGDMTHVIAGPMAWLKLAAAFRVGTKPAGANPEMFAGLTLTPFMEGSMNNVRTYKTSFWNTSPNNNKILIIRRGANWSDTPYVWAPYATYMSPVLTLPDVLTQKMGLLDRAAHQVVVGDSIGTVSIVAGTGIPINDYS